jgi:hypothetical protein
MSAERTHGHYRTSYRLVTAILGLVFEEKCWYGSGTPIKDPDFGKVCP